MLLCHSLFEGKMGLAFGESESRSFLIVRYSLKTSLRFVFPNKCTLGELIVDKAIESLGLGF